MLVYFFCITYGIYLATILEFIFFTDIFFIKNHEFGEFDFYKGRKPWDVYSIDLYWEANLKVLSGLDNLEN